MNLCARSLDSVLQKTFRAAIARLVYKYQRTVSEVRQQILFLLNRLRAADDPAGFGLAAAATAADAAERVPGFLATCQVRWSFESCTAPAFDEYTDSTLFSQRSSIVNICVMFQFKAQS